jgi:NADH peroxidase
MMDEVVQRYYDTEFTSLLAKKLTDNGIALCLEEVVREFTGVDGKVTGVVTDKNTHPADLTIFSV